MSKTLHETAGAARGDGEAGSASSGAADAPMPGEFRQPVRTDLGEPHGLYLVLSVTPPVVVDVYDGWSRVPWAEACAAKPLDATYAEQVLEARAAQLESDAAKMRAALSSQERRISDVLFTPMVARRLRGRRPSTTSSD